MCVCVCVCVCVSVSMTVCVCASVDCVHSTCTLGAVLHRLEQEYRTPCNCACVCVDGKCFEEMCACVCEPGEKEQ